MAKMHEITLSEFIKELQSVEGKYGDWSLSSIGRCSGIVGKNKLESPFSFTFVKNSNRWERTEIGSESVYIASRSEDVGKAEEE